MLSAVLFAVLAGLAWTAYYNFILWLRGRSPQARERAIFKARMPGWLKLAEMALWITFWLGSFFALFPALLALHDSIHHSTSQPDSISSTILLFSALIAVLVPSMLAMNFVSWIVPAMRRANEAAMSGLPAASFRKANLGLVRLAAFLVPLSMAVAITGVLCP